jgi:type IV secretory pathway VirB4 component
LSVVLGTPGHGKSAFAKAELLRVRPDSLLIADPEAEYAPVVQALGGDIVAKLPVDFGTQHRLGLDLRSSHEGAADLAAVPRWALRQAETLEGRQPLWLTLDEAHLWLRSPAGRDALVDLAKRARKRGMVVTLVSQNVGDFTQSDAGRLILANAGRLVLFRQQLSDLPRLGELLQLSERALDLLRVSRPGECLLLDEHGPIPLRVSLPEEVMPLVDTRPAFARYS